MAVRLRPQSAAWMAPHALAAQLTAQAGESAGQGVAGLLGGIARGVGAYTQARDRRQEMAINESRYQDALSRRDREFNYGAAKDQAALLEDYMKGAEMEASLSALSSPTGTPDPSKVEQLRKAQSSMTAMRAQLAKIGGVTAANVPEMPAPPPMATGSFTPQVQEETRKLAGYESLSPEELTTVVESLSAEADNLKGQMDSIMRVGGIKGAAAAARIRTAYAEKSREAAIASGALKRMEKQESRAQKMADKPPETVELGTPMKQRAERDKVLDATRYAMSLGYTGDVFPNIESANNWIRDNQITDPNNAAAAARKADAAKVRAENQQALVDRRAKAAMDLADHVASIKEPAVRAKAMKDAIQNQQRLVKELKDEYELLKTLQGKGLVGENDPDVVGAPGKPSAYDRYEAERNVLMDMMKQAPQAASVAPKPWANDPDFLKLTPEQKAAFEARMNGR